jgi:membrane fusion protein (multidrug efflux system)
MSEVKTVPADSGGSDGRGQAEGLAAAEKAAEVATSPAANRRGRPWRRIALTLLGLLALGAALYFGIPWLRHTLSVVTTDDAYVSGHITYLGPRISSRVEQVLVDEAQFVRAGSVLVRLDPQPYRLAVEEAEAALQLVQADLEQTRANVRAQVSTSRANQYLLRSAVNEVRDQVASLRAGVAQLRLDQAKLALAEKDFARISKLFELKVETQEDCDRSRAALEVARHQVASQRQIVQRLRAQLGLPPNDQNPGEVPQDIERRYPQIQVAISNWATSLIQIGIPLSVVGLSPEAVERQLQEWAAAEISSTKLDSIVEQAPTTLVAKAKVKQAQATLDQARLNLSYTEITAPLDGYVAKRTVNVGDYVSPGQNLLAVQSLRDVWIEANFKETQLDDLRIGQPVDIYVDAYPGRVFSGRVAGFSPSTGSQLSLLPPENATGNFVKVVQRLPVRIELTEPNSWETPLLVGLSVEPEVRYQARPSGPQAGQRLQMPDTQPPPGATPSAATPRGDLAPVARARSTDPPAGSRPKEQRLEPAH